MRRFWPIASLLAALVVAPAAHAATSPTLNGAFERVPAKSDNIGKAIDQTVSHVNFVIRTFAHSRLTDTNRPYTKLAFTCNGSEIRVNMDAQPVIATSVSGKTTKWRREDGQVFDVSSRFVGGKLAETFSSSEGKRTNTYSLSSDGKTLYMDVRVTSPRLPEPLTYREVYRRIK